MYSDWPVTQLTDSGGSPADPFILPALAQNQCVTVSARATTSGDGISGDGDESLPDGLIAIVRGS